MKAKLKGHRHDVQEDKKCAKRLFKATQRVIAILKQRQSVCKVETEDFFAEISDIETKNVFMKAQFRTTVVY